MMLPADIDKNLPPVRRFKRRPFHSRVIMLAMDRVSFADSIEISEGGLLISTPLELKPGECIEINFFIFQNKYVRLTGEVIYILDDTQRGATGGEKYFRVGVRFKDISESHVRLIRNYVSKSP